MLPETFKKKLEALEPFKDGLQIDFFTDKDTFHLTRSCPDGDPIENVRVGMPLGDAIRHRDKICNTCITSPRKNSNDLWSAVSNADPLIDAQARIDKLVNSPAGLENLQSAFIGLFKASAGSTDYVTGPVIDWLRHYVGDMYEAIHAHLKANLTAWNQQLNRAIVEELESNGELEWAADAQAVLDGSSRDHSVFLLSAEFSSPEPTNTTARSADIRVLIEVLARTDSRGRVREVPGPYRKVLRHQKGFTTLDRPLSDTELETVATLHSDGGIYRDLHAALEAAIEV